ncbi:glycosyltransferase family 4 protein [Lederbergia lenta]|uniref:glycosyltransferase family 4 protein n=1 Tax=Lederbergia lenta TaxID=1467 RepID=UPI0020425D55|nr:glycosyltransferase family 4 protein [Lederbergia lenta]MCM3111980.1 glycosyltransferase family 4 protein [Lederbergia lenta]
MDVLHLCSYYIGNKLYKKLFSKLSEYKIIQTVYIPIKSKNVINRNLIETQGLNFHYDLILRKHDKYLYKSKVRKQKKRVEEQTVGLQSTSVIHAHTLFSDGGTAYLIKKKHRINYIISVRNTDINIFYKYAIHHRPFIHKVLQNASAVVFISHAYKKKTLDLLPPKVVDSIKNKIHVIPNGIDDKWFTSKLTGKKREQSDPIRLLFTGSIDRNKNLITVINLAKKIYEEGKDVYLDVAGDGPLLDDLIAYTDKIGISARVNFHGKVSKEKLINIVDQADVFILPSYRETFGISYIEAMSRGLPIIYTRNEGIDGYFPEGVVGFSIDPSNVHEIKDKLRLVLENYEDISKRCISEAKRFNWKEISYLYFNLYKNC